jgi:hypothetical protein
MIPQYVAVLLWVGAERRPTMSEFIISKDFPRNQVEFEKVSTASRHVATIWPRSFRLQAQLAKRYSLQLFVRP